MFILFLIFLLLYGCGGGGGAKEDNHKSPPYVVMIHQAKQLTDGKYNKGDSVVVYGEGVNLVIWADDRDNFNFLHGEDIWGAIVTPDGHVVKSFPALKRSGRDIHPHAVYDKKNKRFAVIWESFSGVESSKVGYALIDISGNIITVGTLPLSALYVDFLSIKSISDGFVIAYKDISLGDFIGSKLGKLAVTDKDLNVKRIITFTEDSSYGVKTEPMSIAFDCNGRDTCFVAYGQFKEIFRDGSQHIFGRIIDINTGSISDELKLTDDTYGKAATKTLVDVVFGKDKYLVTWKNWDSVQGTISVDLEGKFVFNTHNISNNILISDFRWDKKADIKTGLNGMVYYGKTAYSEAANRFYIVWSDSRTGEPLEYHLFMRRLNLDGTFHDKDCIKINSMTSRTPWIAIGDNSIFVTYANSGVRPEHGFFTSDIFGIALSPQLIH